MTRRTTLLPLAAAVTLATLGFVNAPARAVELLVNENLESSVAPPNWTVEQTVTGLPGASVNASEQIGFANEPTDVPGELGIFVRPFAGNQGTYAGQNQKINYVLSQTVNVMASAVGKTFTFTGHSYFAGDADPLTNDGYSGGVTTLDPMSPSLNPAGDYNENGAVDAADYVVWRDNPESLPREAVSFGLVDQEDYDFWRSRFGVTATDGTSPTQTTFELAFLNASNAVIGTPTMLDLRTEQMNDATWRTHMVSAVAPAGTAKVQVTAAARDMVENFGFQQPYLDNFSLMRSDLGTADLLLNGNLNTVGPPNGYEVTETRTPPETDPIDTVSFRDFADHTHFLTGNGEQGIWLRAFEPGDGIVSQTVAGMPGGNYTFSAWSAWEFGYSGGLPGTTTETFIRMEFLDSSNSVIGTPLELDLADAGQINDDEGGTEEDDWRQFMLNGTSPAGTAFVRVSVGAIGMGDSGFNPQSAFFDDLSLDLAAGSALAAAVPEPAGCCLALMALLGGAVIRRRSLATM